MSTSSPSVDIAYVTYEQTDDDQDLALVLTAARRLAISIEAVTWDDPFIDWSRFRCAVVRSTWDYVEKYEQFRIWLTDVDAQTLLLNPRSMIESNLDKRYLRSVEVPIVPTVWIDSVKDLDLIASIDSAFVVIKPTISAGARDTIRTHDRGEAHVHAETILASGRTVMAQPYLDGVDTTGEISVICIDGEPRWAARKVPALTQGGHGGSKEAVALTEVLTSAARRALIGYPNSLYARVDLVEHDGQLVLMELELAEPSLFLPLAPADAADHLLDAIVRRITAD